MAGGVKADSDANIHSGNVTLGTASKLSATYNEGTAASDGTVYYSFLSSITASPASAAEVGVVRGRYNWYVGDNGNFVSEGVEGVSASYGADESMTGRGVYGRTYIAPGATMRTGVGGEFSARASYSGGDAIAAESGTAFVGARIWMAPYFTNISTANVNNFHGLWIYNEHPTVAVTNGIYISNAASGGYKYGLNLSGANISDADIVLENGQTISNGTAGTVSVSGALSVTSATVTNQFLMGSGTAISTMTPTALTLDDGVTFTLNGPFILPSKTEANLKLSTPTAVGEVWYDSTNKAVIISTATANCGDWGQINAGGTAPAGW
jgi:hypothetical protein